MNYKVQSYFYMTGLSDGDKISGRLNVSAEIVRESQEQEPTFYDHELYQG